MERKEVSIKESLKRKSQKAKRRKIKNKGGKDKEIKEKMEWKVWKKDFEVKVLDYGRTNGSGSVEEKYGDEIWRNGRRENRTKKKIEKPEKEKKEK